MTVTHREKADILDMVVHHDDEHFIFILHHKGVDLMDTREPAALTTIYAIDENSRP